MASGSAGPDLLNQLKVLFRFGVVGDLSDGQLLQRFLTARDGADQAAFTVLVARHGPMVLGVCREILGDSHDAEDAFQATFMVLARKAGSVRKADSLASWLHGVARRVATRSKAEAARRRVNELRSGERKAAELEPRGGTSDWRPELHEEIARLPERYREPVVLFYLEGLTTEEAASRIGCPHGTILSRLSRARRRLRGQLERRDLTSSMALLAAESTPRPSVELPARVLDTAVRAAFGSGSASATALAKGVLHTMTISKLKVLGAVVLTCGFAWGGARTFGQLGGLGRDENPVGVVQDPKERPPTLSRSVDRLQSELDESDRRNAEMRKALQDIRAELKARRAGPQPSAAGQAATRLSEAIKTDSADAASRLADALKRHPARLGVDSGFGSQIYMLDLVEGGITLIADEPAPGLVCCGMPKWSNDGSRILFDAASGERWPLARLWAIGAGDGRPTYTDLGLGNCPTFSPDDKRIAFLLHPSAELGADTGVWLMHADGSQRRRVGEFGAPFWSPDGREFLINSYSLPTTSTVINLESRDGGVVEVPEYQIFSWPSWAGPGTVVAVLSPKEKYKGDLIALLDVRVPAETKIIEVLWKRGEGLDIAPRWPVYRPETRECFFVGEEPKKRKIYSVRRGVSLQAKEVGVTEEQHGPRTHLASLSFSPDGRYLIFQSNQLVRR